MAVLLFDGREIETDDEGYLLNLDDYSDELRDFMASEMELELTDEHMVIINTVREYYKEYDTTPPIRGLIQLLKKQGHTELASSVKLARLFPDGAAKCAAKLAGLPKPAKCI
ncbi:TusE/DsrC/DsvC family sulfur relay protein [uncultured Anaerobiospirillum sp.]|uniref:TusE/DsrC/DsvC family sulfur relay protein n=1 Tax=uncultured Anaerobiospirillum sp. TaxID=265728 RepID=UPI0028046F83|nr:TusE/DsrC/DsvC family sulfur relay protein [uncultured Anaerobiospirillum sp.]